MAELIDFESRMPSRNNLVVAHPLEFRRGDWPGGYTMMCTREESSRYEAHRLEALRSQGHQHIAFVPIHIPLDAGYHYTVMGLFRHHHDETLMRRVYRLAGLMECVTNMSSSVLRTDLLRRFYQSILEEREELGVLWRGNVRYFLLPIGSEHYNTNLFFHRVAQAESLKALYDTIEAETNAQFDILSQRYVFYLPGHLQQGSHGQES